MTPITFDEFWATYQDPRMPGSSREQQVWPEHHTERCARAAWEAARVAFESDATETAYRTTLERAKAAEAEVKRLERALWDIRDAARNAVRR